ncbi:hypothetical protein HYV69_02370 [Candidatus Uhrbacteria bacterium]|nr:hypothetical protein [Candidatus Uhrbacteria bacterium]
MDIHNEIKKGIACDSVNKPHSAVGRAVCISVHPGKMFLLPFLHWFNTRYKGRYKFARLVFLLDLFLIGIAVALAIVSIIGFLFVPKSFEDGIVFESSVAPTEVVSGSPSTLIIRYTNKTKEELRNAKVEIKYPKYFLLQETSPEEIGIIPIGGSGTIHIKGTMFGDVGGEQTFQTRLSFVHGEKFDVFGEKTDTYVFSPSSSALSLSLELPDKMVAYQPIEGIIHYKNTSEINFPKISIKPIWPKEFIFTKGQFEVPTVKSGEKGEVKFEGILQNPQDEITFIFEPSFTFGKDKYKQETLQHTAPIIPLPLTLNHSVEKQTVRPGEDIKFTIQYENISDVELSNVSFTMDAQSPFVKKSSVVSREKIAPKETGTVEITTTLRKTIAQSETSVYENLKIPSRPTATYTIKEDVESTVTSKGATIESQLTTPIIFDSFARYTTATGDQIGRGPIPPQSGKETTYWIFWHVSGTTNELSNVEITGILPANVRFTGRQTVSQNKGVEYDPNTREISWKSDSVMPTLSPTSKIVGIAFELGVTPTVDNLTHELLGQIQLNATDGWTGAIINTSKPDISALLTK